MSDSSELQACTPIPLNKASLNLRCSLPYDLKPEHVFEAMVEFLDFLGFVNRQLHTKNIPRLESFLMPAGFSSLVGEYMAVAIPKYCAQLVKNQYHNGHPDLIPAGMFPQDAVQYTHEGIEIKASRQRGSWQGHNPEAVWLTVFHFESNSANDARKQVAPKPFRFRGVYAAKLNQSDWAFSGRAPDSRRTITASVTSGGVAKMKSNWIYEDSVR